MRNINQNMLSKIIKLFERYFKLVVVTLFILIFAVGTMVFRDYGITWDDPTERYTTCVNIMQVAKHFSIPFDEHFDYFRDIEDYCDKYYGVAFQLPSTLLEYLFMDKISIREVYLIRHFSVFVVYFFSLICLYLLCFKLFKSRLTSLFAVLMVFLYPRFFAEAFYNIKDVIFSSSLIIALYFCIVFLANKRKPVFAVLSGIFTALALNARFYGLFLFGLVVCLMLFEDIVAYFDIENKYRIVSDKRTRKTNLSAYLIFIFSFCLAFIIVTPASWSNPVFFVFEYIRKFVGYDPWNDPVLFAGKSIIKNELPYNYLVVWYAISIPLIYLVFCMVGIVALAKDTFWRKNVLSAVIKNRFLLLVFVLFATPVFVTLSNKGMLYDAWRQMYFTFPLLVLLAVYGLHAFIASHRRFVKVAAFALIIVSLILQTGWIVKNHPHENVYLNMIGKHFGDKFERDYWGLSNMQLLNWIAQNDKAPSIKVSSVHGQELSVTSDILLPKIKERFVLVQVDEADYIITTLRCTIGNDVSFEGFHEVHSIWVDGYKIGSVLKRKEAK
jgi:hypothetical protein